jgi:hypothetical protein
LNRRLLFGQQLQAIRQRQACLQQCGKLMDDLATVFTAPLCLAYRATA